MEDEIENHKPQLEEQPTQDEPIPPQLMTEATGQAILSHQQAILSTGQGQLVATWIVAATVTVSAVVNCTGNSDLRYESRRLVDAANDQTRLLRSIDGKVNTTNSKLTSIDSDTNLMQWEISSMARDTRSMRSNINSMESHTSSTRWKIGSIENDTTSIRSKMNDAARLLRSMERDTGALRKSVPKIETAVKEALKPR